MRFYPVDHSTHDGSPIEHRTDSLIAARKNKQNSRTDAYTELCEHYLDADYPK